MMGSGVRIPLAAPIKLKHLQSLRGGFPKRVVREYRIGKRPVSTMWPRPLWCLGPPSKWAFSVSPSFRICPHFQHGLAASTRTVLCVPRADLKRPPVAIAKRAGPCARRGRRAGTADRRKVVRPLAGSNYKPLDIDRAVCFGNN
jgi:hypothetical protein